MTTWEKGHVIANGVRLHYHRTGSGAKLSTPITEGTTKPSLVIATGVTDMGLGYARIARALEAEYDVIMYDKRGHGDSEKPETGYTFADHAGDLMGLIDALHVERPTVLAHSGGAAAAIIAAADHPDLMAGLILYDPCWGSGWGGWEATTAGLSGWFSDVVNMSRDALSAKWREEHPTWTEEELAIQIESKTKVSPSVAQTFDQPAPGWQEALRQIQCPILLLTGDREHGLVTPDDVQAMSALWHNGRVVQIDGAGHMVHHDRFEPFVQAVQDFLAKI